MAQYAFSNMEENRIWLQILGDGALLISHRLLPDIPEAQQAKAFADSFDRLLSRAMQKLTAGELDQLNREAYTATRDIREFFLNILRKTVTQGFLIMMKPIYINNFISLVEKYLYLLGLYMDNREPDFVPVVQDIFWLPIFYADARLIADNVGNFQENIRNEANEFSKNFTSLFQFAFELQGVFRIGQTDFPIANQYRKVVREALEQFAVLVVDLIRLAQQNMIPGTLTLLSLDNTYRKLCYYTTQLSIMAGLPKPACDPASPRLRSLSE